MSIWCSHETIGFEQVGYSLEDDDGAPIKPTMNGNVRSYASGWSNHYPTTDGGVEQPAAVDLASIAPWCVPGNQEDNVPLMAAGPWLRMCVTSWGHCVMTTPAVPAGHPNGEMETASVVMDESAVVALRDQLNAWLAKAKVYPVTA